MGGGGMPQPKLFECHLLKKVETVEHHLCGEYAQLLCYGTGSIWVHDDDLWNYFEHVGDVKEGNALYNYTKQKAFDTMDKVLEMRLSFNGIKEFKCPDLLVENYKPYACRLSQWIIEYILVVLAIHKDNNSDLAFAIDTGSQVCNLAWSKNVNELVRLIVV
ncbi:protein FIZZY-RELATED [Trifolium repens]|nr:protein FIZZY-RELATED [Trifolium repens]